jgi:hypothetical protein
VVFPIPPVCAFLTHDTKENVFRHTEDDEKGSKVTNFFEQREALLYEMEWQQTLRSKVNDKKIRVDNCPKYAYLQTFSCIEFQTSLNSSSAVCTKHF